MRTLHDGEMKFNSTAATDVRENECFQWIKSAGQCIIIKSDNYSLAS